MNKIKWSILTLAVLLSVGSAFATRTHHQSGLYWSDGYHYYPVYGEEGTTWVCVTPSSNVCTFYLLKGVYTPYETAAQYTPVTLTKSKPTPKPDPKSDPKKSN